MKRGLTMIELLMALSLLAVLMVAVASWTQIAARASARAAQPTRWQTVAEATLELIGTDLLVGDFEPNPRRPRVVVYDQRLEIRTRQGSSGDNHGSVTHRYIFNPPDHELRLEERAVHRILLDRVDDWRCTVDEEEQVLTVTIIARHGYQVTRSYLLP